MFSFNNQRITITKGERIKDLNSSNNNKASSKNDNNNNNNEQIIESSDIFFFYRPKIDTKEVKDIEDVQRFYMVTCNNINKIRRLQIKIIDFLCLVARRCPR